MKRTDWRLQRALKQLFGEATSSRARVHLFTDAGIFRRGLGRAALNRIRAWADEEWKPDWVEYVEYFNPETEEEFRVAISAAIARYEVEEFLKSIAGRRIGKREIPKLNAELLELIARVSKAD
jgi:hypothetical protein